MSHFELTVNGWFQEVGLDTYCPRAIACFARSRGQQILLQEPASQTFFHT